MDESGQSQGADNLRKLAASPVSKVALLLLVYFFYLRLSFIIFEPMEAWVDTALIGGEQSDVLRNAWGYWWVKTMLFEHVSLPAYSNYLNYPSGMTILVIDLLNCLIALPLHLFFDMPEVYNYFIVGVFAFNAWSGFLLFEERLGHKGAALMGGTVFGFCPFVFSNALAGTSELVNVGWIALYLRALLRILWPTEQTPTGRHWIHAGLTMCAMTLSCWYYGYITGVASLFLMGAALLRLKVSHEDWKMPALGVLKHWGIFAGFTVLMVAVYWEIVPNLTQSVGSAENRLEMIQGDAIRLWELIQPENSRWQKPTLHHLPLYVLALAPLGWLINARRTWMWIAPCFFFLLLALSLGQQLPLPHDQQSVLGYLTAPLPHEEASVQYSLAIWLLSTVQSVATPFYNFWFNYVPLGSMVRFPSRYLVIVNLVLTFSATAAVARILYQNRWTKPLWVVLALLGSVFLTQDLVQLGRYHDVLYTTQVVKPAYVERLKADTSTRGAVILPIDQGKGNQIFYQAFHHKKLMAFVNFVTSNIRKIQLGGQAGDRLPMSYVETVFAIHRSGYDSQAQRYPDSAPPLPGSARTLEDISALAYADFGYLILEVKLFRSEDYERIVHHLDQYLVAVESGESTGYRVYEIPSTSELTGQEQEPNNG